jgi:hypothetical protein
MYAHRDEHVTAYLAAADEAFGELADALRKGDLSERMKGGPATAGFRRLA